MYRFLSFFSVFTCLAGCSSLQPAPDTGEPTPFECSAGNPNCLIPYDICVEGQPPYKTWVEFADGHGIDCEDAGGCFDEAADIRDYCRLDEGGRDDG